jgi:hypothetical protein
MRLAQRCLGIVFVFCALWALYLSFRGVALPDPSLIDAAITASEPVQEPTDRGPFTTGIDGYTYRLVPRAAYDISGLVVSRHRGDALLNLYHKADPGNIEDVCVVWGEPITNGSYRAVTYSSGEFTCSYEWSGSVAPPFNPAKLANNHLVAADGAVARRIRALRVGDQVRLRGLLVDYTVTRDGSELFSRRTSLTRTDTGNGACEILYATDVSVIRPANRLRAEAARYAWWASLGALVALAVVWLARPPFA